LFQKRILEFTLNKANDIIMVDRLVDIVIGEKRNKKKIIMITLSITILMFFCISCYIINDYLQSPIIELIGEKEMVLYLGEEFKDPGANATLKEQDISKKIKINGKVNCNKIGTYSLKYSISNSKGKNTKTITRQITVIDNVKPVITLKKDTVLVGYKENFKDPGYTAIDNYDGDITNKVEVVGKVDTSKLGTYELSYIVSDSSNNRTIAKRKVKVIDNTAPRITLKGEKRVVLNLNQPFQEPGYTAIDDLDGDVTKNVKVSKSINTAKMGVYKVTYSVRDSAGNYNSTTRTVQVGTQTEIDEKNYIAISIADQTLVYYKNGKLIVSSNIVSGQKGSHDSPKGRYRILSKGRSIYLTGPDYKSYVNYWMLYDRSHQIGLHDATWRSSFGGSIYKSYGSHGCINLPYSVAQRIYNNVEIGTLVTVY